MCCMKKVQLQWLLMCYAVFISSCTADLIENAGRLSSSSSLSPQQSPPSSPSATSPPTTANRGSSGGHNAPNHKGAVSGYHNKESRSSYAMLSQAMSQAVLYELSKCSS